MQKKIISIILFALLILSAPALFASSKKADKSSTWRVINIYDSYIELKKGKTELTVYITEKSKFIAKDGTETKKDILMICQYVELDYRKEGTKNILNKIVIKKDSDCIK